MNNNHCPKCLGNHDARFCHIDILTPFSKSSDAHTQGAWAAYIPRLHKRNNNTHDRRIMVLHPDRERLVAHCQTGTHGRRQQTPVSEIEANAYLMAAAPELLNALRLALREAMETLRDLPTDSNSAERMTYQINAFRAAISKATNARTDLTTRTNTHPEQP